MLEARWAIVMDVFNVLFTYEPASYEIPGTLYVPDFWLPSAERFLEIKPHSPKSEEIHKAVSLKKLSGHPVIFLCGFPRVLNGDLGNANILWHDGAALGPGVEMSIRYMYAFGLSETKATQDRLIAATHHAQCVMSNELAVMESMSSILSRMFDLKPEWPEIISKETTAKEATTARRGV